MGDEDRATFTKLPRILTELGAEPVWRPIPPISGDEASCHPVLGALVDRLDGKNSDGLNNYLLEALALSNNVPENTSPPFVRRTWLHLVENLRQLKPDVLVFAKRGTRRI